MRSRRIGELLIQRGLLDEAQVNRILEHQAMEPQPFGQLAASMIGIEPHEVWYALAEQILTRSTVINLIDQPFDPLALQHLSARDAWDCLVLPLRYDGEQLICATTVETLPSAIGLLETAIDVPFDIVLAEIRPLEQFIAERYDYEGIDALDEAA